MSGLLITKLHGNDVCLLSDFLDVIDLSPGDRVIFFDNCIYEVDSTFNGGVFLKSIIPGVLNNAIFTILGMDYQQKYDFQERVLGYYDLKRSTFPACRNRVDLKKFVKAIFEEIKTMELNNK